MMYDVGQIIRRTQTAWRAAPDRTLAQDHSRVTWPALKGLVSYLEAATAVLVEWEHDQGDALLADRERVRQQLLGETDAWVLRLGELVAKVDDALDAGLPDAEAWDGAGEALLYGIDSAPEFVTPYMIANQWSEFVEFAPRLTDISTAEIDRYWEDFDDQLDVRAKARLKESIRLIGSAVSAAWNATGFSSPNMLVVIAALALGVYVGGKLVR